MTTGTLTSEQIKDKAKRIRVFLKEKCGAEISHSHALEVVSQVLGHKDWNTASAAVKSDGESHSSNEVIQTIGELKRAINSLGDDVSIDAEYEFEIGDFTENLDDDVGPDDKIHQEFSIKLERLDEKMAIFRLALTNEDIYSVSDDGVIGRTLRN